MNTYDSPLWGPIREPESIDELLISVLRLKGEREGVRFWRGHADIDWRLDSALYRRVLLRKPFFPRPS